MELREPSAKYLVSPNVQTTELGVFPNDWKIKSLGDFKPYVTSGSRGWARYYAEHGDAFVRITNLSRESVYLDLADLRAVRIPSNDTEAARTALRDGDILISITADVGITGYVTAAIPKPAFINQHIALVRIDPAIADTKYISYFLASPSSQERFGALTDAGAKAGMNLSTVQKIGLALPPTVEEQRRISCALGDADALIKSVEQLLAKKRQIKQGAMQELLTGQRRLPGFGDEWLVKRLDELADIRSGGTPSTNQAQCWDGEILWCTPTDITALDGGKYLEATARTITPLGLNSSSAELIPPNSVVMTSRATIGECAINRVAVTTNQGFKNFVVAPGIDAEFLYYLLLTQRQGFVSLCSGSTFLEIGKAQLRSYEVRVPPTDGEQRAIAEVLGAMDAEIEQVGHKLTKARHLKHAMMQALLTGRIRLASPAAAAGGA